MVCVSASLSPPPTLSPPQGDRGPVGPTGPVGEKGPMVSAALRSVVRARRTGWCNADGEDLRRFSQNLGTRNMKLSIFGLWRGVQWGQMWSQDCSSSALAPRINVFERYNDEICGLPLKTMLS